MREIGPIKIGRPDRAAAQAIGDHVVAVADTLFIERGYGATSMATIALLARVGKQTLYRRFPDKAALFREVIKRRIKTMFAAVPPRGGRDADPLVELKALASAALTMLLTPEFGRLYRILIADALQFPELCAAASDQWGLDRAAGIVARAQAAGKCRAGDPVAIAGAFMWGVIGQAFHDIMTGAGSPFDGEAEKQVFVDKVWDFFLAGATPPSA